MWYEHPSLHLQQIVHGRRRKRGPFRLKSTIILILRGLTSGITSACSSTLQYSVKRDTVTSQYHVSNMECSSEPAVLHGLQVLGRRRLSRWPLPCAYCVSHTFNSASSSSHQFNMLPLTVWTFLCTLVPLTMSSEFLCTHDGKPSDVCDREDYETISDRDAAGYFIHNYGYRRNLEKSVCLNDGDCVDIADGVVYYNDRYNFARGILMGQLLISRAYLKLPKKPEHYDYEIFDTSRWAINKTSLDFFSYTTTMIEEMFASGAVDISREVTAQVLSIGIGGGFINTYLHYNYPNMNITAVDVEPKTLEIAQKWFALELDRRHHVVIMDGIKFIEQAVNEGQKYDAIHIDACTTDQSAELACPLVAFLKPEVVKNLSKLLTKKGVVIMNVISLHGKIQESAKRVRTSFQKFFKVCSIKLAPYSQLNLVATCGQYPRPESLKEKYIEFAKYPPAAYYKDEFP